MAQLDQRVELPVFGRYDGYLFVQAPGGHLGWLESGPNAAPQVRTLEQ